MNREGQDRRSSEKRSKGVALLTVLTMITLLGLLVLMFHEMGRSEMQASSLYREGIYAELLTDTVVNLAIAQVRSATNDPEKLWTSQPGGIRNYDRKGKFVEGYKLYSDDLMLIRGDEQQFAFEDASELSRNWHGDTARYIDLNEPVIRESRAFFPIADPAARREMGVEQFDFDVAKIGAGEFDSALRKVGSQSLPMPVQWLYQLKDGTIGTLDESDRFVVKSVRRDGSVQVERGLATEENPIVARLAFWTDDETTKVNINTASEPTFWDTPRAASRKPNRIREFGDRNYGYSQPAKREYSRYPGHPAQTALSTIFFPDKELTEKDKEILTVAAPRQNWGGSKGGTIPYMQTKPLPINRSHLYPSVDEYIFGENRQLNRLSEIAKGKYSSADLIEWGRFFLTASSRAPELNGFNLPRVSMWPTHAESETSAGKHRTALDDLIRYCSSYDAPPEEEGEAGTGGGGEAEEEPDPRLHFSFQRAESDSPIHDYEEIPRNREIFSYLRELTEKPVPGYGGTFAQKWGEDRDQILTEVFDYIRSTNLYDETLKPVGYTEEKWLEEGKGSQFTDGRRGAKSRAAFPGHGQVVPLEIEEHGTRGFGRFYTVSEVGMMLICCADAGEEDSPFGVLRSNVYSVENELANFPEEQHQRLRTILRKNRALPRKLESKERCLQGVLLFELFCPSQGWTQITDDMTMRVEFTSPLQVDGEEVQFPALMEFDWKSTGDAYTGGNEEKRGSRIGSLGEVPDSSMWGGTVPYWALGRARRVPRLEHLAGDGAVEGNKKNRSEEGRRAFPFVSVPFIVKGNDDTIDFAGGEFTLSIYHGTPQSQVPSEPSEETLVQTFQFEFPPATLPIPELARRKGSRRPRREFPDDGDKERNLADYRYDQNGRPIHSGSGVIHPSYYWLMNNRGCGVGNPEHDHGNWGSWSRHRVPNNEVPDDEKQYNDDGEFIPVYKEKFSVRNLGRLSTWSSDLRTLFAQAPNARGFPLKQGADVVRTLVPIHGDYRHIAATKDVPKEWFVPVKGYDDEQKYLAHHFTATNAAKLSSFGLDKDSHPLVGELLNNEDHKYWGPRKPDFPETEESLTAQKWGDFDNGVSITSDGAYLNKPDEGNGRQHTTKWARITVPYFDHGSQQVLGGPAFFSPNRQVPSPVMFGSLPTGIRRERPWETLLFRPEEGHPGNAVPPDGPSKGAAEPPDHAMLDWFWMPVVEPYAISEPFSTAGKINLNYQILPFSHIRRASGVAAVMKSEELLTIPNWAAAHYKKHALPNIDWNFRHPIKIDETLRQFDEKFEKGEVFRLPSEICEVHLVPKKDGRNPPKLESMKTSFWENHALTGDNTRERPYANIYPRLTTKSNTFRVHYRVQVLKQARESDPEKFEPEWDTVVADSRGDCVFERYLDPAHPELVDYAKDTEPEVSLLALYRYRIISKRRFAR